MYVLEQVDLGITMLKSTLTGHSMCMQSRDDGEIRNRSSMEANVIKTCQGFMQDFLVGVRSLWGTATAF